MALIRRTVAATLAALTLAGAAAQPAQAYWSSTGRGSGAVPTVADALNLVLTVAGTNGKNITVKAAGQAGSGTPYDTTITVVLCRTSPCTTANATVTFTAPVTGTGYSATSPSFNSNGWQTVYGQARQGQGPKWATLSVASLGL